MNIKTSPPSANYYKRSLVVPSALLQCLPQSKFKISDAINNKNNSTSHCMYIKDLISGQAFLVDSSRNYSLFPYRPLNKGESPTSVLHTWSGDFIKTYGTRHISVNFGTSVDIVWTFHLADVFFPSLGGDFIEKHKGIISYAKGTVELAGREYTCYRMPNAPLHTSINITECCRKCNCPVKVSRESISTTDKLVAGGLITPFAPASSPRLRDKLSNKIYLIDSGATKSTIPPELADLPNITHTLGLQAANGSPIPTYRKKELTLDFGLGRVYSWDFLIADVTQPIIGMDFMGFYHWNIDAGSNVIVDQFTLNAAKCDMNSSKKNNKSLQKCALLMDEKCSYATLLRKFPELLEKKPNLKPKHHFKHHIRTNDKPVYCKARLLSPEMTKIAKTAYNKLLRDGVVSPATSEWCSPLHFVLRRDGTYRMVGDYRRLNNITTRDIYPLPFLQSFSADLHGKRIFSKIDLREAFLQIPVATEDVQKTTITTPFGAFSYNQMPFGLSGAAQTFQRFITEVMRDLKKTHNGMIPEEISVFSYIDDILVASKDEESHLEDLTAVFERLAQFGLRLNIDKCEFGKTNLTFLGHYIDAQGIQPVKEKVSAIQKMVTPKTVKELRRYLGMLNFYRRFIPHAAETLIPLYDLLVHHSKMRKNTPLAWSSWAEMAFRDAKQALAGAALLAYPAPGAEISLAADASDVAIGAVLQQKDPVTGEQQPLGFFSKRLTAREKNLTVFARELLAVHAGLRHFLYYLQGREFVILTDHQALISAAKNAGERQSRQETRQFQFISEHTSNWRHVAGSSNIAADTLSRSVLPFQDSEIETAAITIGQTTLSTPPSEVYADTVTSSNLHTHYTYCNSVSEASNKIQLISATLKHVDFDDLANAQSADTELQQILQNQDSQSPQLTLVNKLYCNDKNNVARPFIPVLFRKKIFHITHDIAHPSGKRTVQMISSRFFWPNMKKEVTLWSRACLACQSAKVHRHNIPPVIKMIPASEKFGSVNIDFVGPLPASRGYQYLMTAIDRYSRWVEAIPMQSATAEATADSFVTNWVSRFGIPETITTDRGTNFQSELFNRLLQQLGCTHHSTTAYHPQHNGIIERFHRTLKDALRATATDPSWTDRLPLILLMLRTSPRSDGQPSPAEIVYGTPLRLPVDLLIPPQDKIHLDQSNYTDRLKQYMQEVKPIITSQNRPKNELTYTDPLLKTSSKVLIRNMTKRGLEPNYTGPFDVIRISDNYVTIRRPNGRMDTVALGNVKASYSQEDILQHLLGNNSTRTPIANKDGLPSASESNPPPRNHEEKKSPSSSCRPPPFVSQDYRLSDNSPQYSTKKQKMSGHVHVAVCPQQPSFISKFGRRVKKPARFCD